MPLGLVFVALIIVAKRISAINSVQDPAPLHWVLLSLWSRDIEENLPGGVCSLHMVIGRSKSRTTHLTRKTQFLWSISTREQLCLWSQLLSKVKMRQRGCESESGGKLPINETCPGDESDEVPRTVLVSRTEKIVQARPQNLPVRPIWLTKALWNSKLCLYMCMQSVSFRIANRWRV